MDEQQQEVQTEKIEQPVPVAPKISYDDFAKCEFRVGEIKSVDLVEKSEKLLRLTVDFAEATPWQIVSGIRGFFSDPQVLVGKKCAFATNLEHRMLMGLESQGMILGVNDDSGHFSLLSVDQSIPAGTKVK